jgi:ribosomal protein S18 acetylase RimI-like enzyme
VSGPTSVPIEIKLLHRGDAHVLTSVALDVFDDALDPAATAMFLADSRHHLAVALDDGVVVGFASAVTYVHPDKPQPELWINEVGVAPTHQRRGIGRLVLEALLDVARREHCSEAWVLADRSNTGAQRFYASLGAERAREDAVMFTFPLDGRVKGET